MRTKAKALPYPVLGRGDDFTDSQFQSSLEASIRRVDETDTVVLAYRFLLSSPEVEELLGAGLAVYALDVQCSDTLFRKVFRCDPTGEITFSGGELHGRVEIQPCVIAVSRISDFHVSDLNEEFGSSTISLDPGDVFAIDDIQVRFVEFSRMKLESLVKVKVADDLPDHRYRVDLDGEMIIIFMGAGCKRVWDAFRADKEAAPFLAMSIYKDCMHAALHALCVNEGSADLRWGRALSDKLASDGIDLPQQPSFESLSSISQDLISRIGILRLMRNVD